MNNYNKTKIFTHYFFIFLTSFFIGVIFSLYYLENSDNKLLKNIQLWDKSFIIKDKDLDLTKFWEVYNLIKLNDYNLKWIKKEDLVDGAINWLVEWLDDKFSEYFNIEEKEKFNQILSWDFEGIWAVVEANEIWVIIDRLIKWSPAKKYWLKSWDIIIKANDFKLEWLELYDAVEKIKWPAWSIVKLEVIRKWESNILTFDVIREKIQIPSVESEEFEDWKIWYISINLFWEHTSSEFKYELDKFMEKEWIVIDLRYNWWWYLNSATEILSNLIENNKTLVVTKYRDMFSNISYPSINDWNIYEWKIVVLINESSASASEITAWALKDYKKAILVWKKTYWKWSVQKPFDLSDWSMLKLTIAKWFTPNDINIDEEWIIPDIEVWFNDEDFENWYDRQLEIAKEVLLKFIDNNVYQLTIDQIKSKIEEEKIQNTIINEEKLED